MPAASRRAFSQTGDGADRRVAEEAADVARAAFEVLDRDVDGLVAAAAAGRFPGGGASSQVEKRGDLARDAVDGEQIGPVVARLELEHACP